MTAPNGAERAAFAAAVEGALTAALLGAPPQTLRFPISGGDHTAPPCELRVVPFDPAGRRVFATVRTTEVEATGFVTGVDFLTGPFWDFACAAAQAELDGDECEKGGPL